MHDHTGVYSFVIWMKIPYSWDEQIKLSQFKDIQKRNLKAGSFEFIYSDIFGDVMPCSYKLSPKYEGVMIFFPARLKHCVYPFYETEEPRISISGNLSYSPGWNNQETKYLGLYFLFYLKVLIQKMRRLSFGHFWFTQLFRITYL